MRRPGLQWRVQVPPGERQQGEFPYFQTSQQKYGAASFVHAVTAFESIPQSPKCYFSLQKQTNQKKPPKQAFKITSLNQVVPRFPLFYV